mgnify:CR=1 FL=1
MEEQATKQHTLQFLSYAGRDFPRLWLSYQAIQLSSSYADFHSHAQRALGDFIIPLYILPILFGEQHAALPIGFPHPDKLRMIGCFLVTILSGYLYPTAC